MKNLIVNRRVYRLMATMFMGMLLAALAACVPWAEFTVDPMPVVAGQSATFDASSSVVSEKEHGQVTYDWDFGDGTTPSSGKIVTHTFAAKGTYNVTLTITPSKGQDKNKGKDKDKAKVGTVTKSIQVASSVAEGRVSVQVQSSDGVLVPNAKVVIGTLNTTSDAKGIAIVDNVPSNGDQALAQELSQAVTVTKTGYVSQTVRVAISPNNTTKLLVTLLPVKESRVVSQGQIAQVIASKTLGASVTLPANALVNTNNQVVTSAISAHLSPFDIKSQDMQAMLGNGRGRDASGNLVRLISAGVFSIDFYDAQNGHLQLASGKTADIQMDLPYASINGRALTVGTTMPLWHFDTLQGIWLAQGTGTVVASSSSNVGLAVKASVGHFSTWSWGFAMDNLGSVTVSCVNAALQLTACDLTAVVVLPDNSYYFKSATIAAEVTTVVDMPTVGTVSWIGSTNQGQQGFAQSSTSGDVVVTLAAAQTDNFVQCKLADMSPASCDVVTSIALGSGGSVTLQHYIPAEGAWVRTAYYTPNPIAWLASTGFSLNGSGQLARYEGSATSASTGNVNITLSNQVLAENKLLVLSCDTGADIYPAGTYLGQPSLPTPTVEALTSCNIGVSVLGTNSSFNYASPTIPPGVAVNLLVPPLATMDTVYVGAVGRTAQNSYVSTYTSMAASALTSMQTMLLRLHNLVAT